MKSKKFWIIFGLLAYHLILAPAFVLFMANNTDWDSYNLAEAKSCEFDYKYKLRWINKETVQITYHGGHDNLNELTNAYYEALKEISQDHILLNQAPTNIKSGTGSCTVSLIVNVKQKEK